MNNITLIITAESAITPKLLYYHVTIFRFKILYHNILFYLNNYYNRIVKNTNDEQFYGLII